MSELMPLEFKNSLPDIIGEPLKFAPKLILWTTEEQQEMQKY
ncbi:hypothetical protein [Clostridium saccharoperbutylacetonicum]